MSRAQAAFRSSSKSTPGARRSSDSKRARISSAPSRVGRAKRMKRVQRIELIDSSQASDGLHSGRLQVASGGGRRGGSSSSSSSSSDEEHEQQLRGSGRVSQHGVQRAIGSSYRRSRDLPDATWSRRLRTEGERSRSRSASPSFFDNAASDEADVIDADMDAYVDATPHYDEDEDEAQAEARWDRESVPRTGCEERRLEPRRRSRVAALSSSGSRRASSGALGRSVEPVRSKRPRSQAARARRQTLADLIASRHLKAGVGQLLVEYKGKRQRHVFCESTARDCCRLGHACGIPSLATLTPLVLAGR